LKPAFPAPKAPVFEDNFNLRKYEVYSTGAIINIDFNPINIGVAPTTPVWSPKSSDSLVVRCI